MRHRDDKTPARRQRSRDIAEHIHRMNQILHRHRNQHGIEDAGIERQSAITIQILHDNGIMIRGNYVIPPDYTAADFEALAAYAASHRVTFAGYTILTPMPGTVLHRQWEAQIVDRDLDKYNFFNCVLGTALPLTEFYERVAALWTIKQGTEVI